MSHELYRFVFVCVAACCSVFQSCKIARYTQVCFHLFMSLSMYTPINCFFCQKRRITFGDYVTYIHRSLFTYVGLFSYMYRSPSMYVGFWWYIYTGLYSNIKETYLVKRDYLVLELRLIKRDVIYMSILAKETHHEPHALLEEGASDVT